MLAEEAGMPPPVWVDTPNKNKSKTLDKTALSH